MHSLGLPEGSDAGHDQSDSENFGLIPDVVAASGPDIGGSKLDCIIREDGTSARKETLKQVHFFPPSTYFVDIS